MRIRDLKIAKCVIAGDKVTDIAVAIGVSERQVYRRMARADVRGVIDAAARALTRTATLRIQRGAAAAADTLCLMADGTLAPSSGRAAAAGRVVDVAIRALEVEDLLARLLELEILIAEREKARAWGEST